MPAIEPFRFFAKKAPEEVLSKSDVDDLVAQYLAKGGKIEVCPPHAYSDPDQRLLQVYKKTPHKVPVPMRRRMRRMLMIEQVLGPKCKTEKDVEAITDGVHKSTIYHWCCDNAALMKKLHKVYGRHPSLVFGPKEMKKA